MKLLIGKIIKEKLSKTKRIKQKKRDVFNEMIHELKTPLTVILGFAQLLKEEERYNCDRDYIRAINCIEAEGKRINTIIDKYADLSR